MMKPLRVVSPYRPFAPESHAHALLGPFDWVGALEMLTESVTRSNRCETVPITDVDTDLPMRAFQYRTTARRLMIWILEVSLCYLRSGDFDRDTVMLSPDLLVFKDLRPWMGEYLGILMRTGFPDHPILNGVQFWPHAKKAEIVAFYADALAIAQTLPENFIRWGGDTEPLRRLLAPLAPGPVVRNGRVIAHLLEAKRIMQPFTTSMANALTHGYEVPAPVMAVLDFKYTRKRYMRPYFQHAFRVAA